MAHYDALIKKWSTLSGSMQEKVDAINALTVQSSVAVPAILQPSEILNCCLPADILALSVNDQNLFWMLTNTTSIDYSIGSTARSAIDEIFSNCPGTLKNLTNLAAKYDTPTILWTEANGYTPINNGDLGAAGLL